MHVLQIGIVRTNISITFLKPFKSAIQGFAFEILRILTHHWLPFCFNVPVNMTMLWMLCINWQLILFASLELCLEFRQFEQFKLRISYDNSKYLCKLSRVIDDMYELMHFPCFFLKLPSWFQVVHNYQHSNDSASNKNKHSKSSNDYSTLDSKYL